MAKLREASDEAVQFVNEIVDMTELKQAVTFQVLFDDSLKRFAKVAKGNGVVEYLKEVSPVVVVYLNERLFNAFEFNERRMLLENELLGVSYDWDKERLAVKQPDMALSSECWRRYGTKLLNAYMACLISEKKEDGDE